MKMHTPAVGCLLLGCFLTTSMFLMVTTLHYRRKIRKLKMVTAQDTDSEAVEEKAQTQQPLDSAVTQSQSRSKSRNKRQVTGKPLTSTELVCRFPAPAPTHTSTRHHTSFRDESSSFPSHHISSSRHYTSLYITVT